MRGEIKMGMSKKEVISYTALLTMGIALVTKGSAMIEAGEYKFGCIITGLGMALIGLFIALSYKEQ